MIPAQSRQDSMITLNVVSPKFIIGARIHLPYRRGYIKLLNGEIRIHRLTTPVLRLEKTVQRKGGLIR